MLVLGLGGAAISIVNKDLSLTISGMSLAAIIGIILNYFLPEEEKEIATLIKEDKRTIKQDINKIKQDIKEELTMELKEDIINEIKKEMNKTKGKNRK